MTVCPACGRSVIPVPIVYGDPLPDTEARAALGEIVLGGCVLTGDDPEWACPACREPMATIVAVLPVDGGEAGGR